MASPTTSLPTKFQHFESIWKQVTKKSRLNGSNERRLLGWEIKDQAKRFGPTPSNIASFFGNTMFDSKNDPHQIQFEEDLFLFITKEVESSCFFSIKMLINE